MAEEVEMIPVEMTPVDEPPKANPLAKPTSEKPKTLKLNPVERPTVPGLKPGLKLPPKPGATVGALRPGLKLPPKPGATISALKPGLKLPPKPGATISTLKPGLKLPPKPGATVSALKPGLKLPSKPVIRKPGATVSTASLPKPIVPTASQPAVAPTPKPMEALKSMTQKLKGITQELPQQAILHKTGIIADGSSASAAAAKEKTSRIPLASAVGAAPVSNDAMPMKTIRIKRPVDIPGATKPLVPQSRPETTPAAAASTATPATPAAPATPAPGASAAPEASAAPAAAKPAGVSVTQRKTLKIARPGGGAVRPTGKFGVKKPALAPAGAAKPPAAAEGKPPAAEGEVADIPDLPVSAAPVPHVTTVPDVAPWATTLSVIVQVAACGAVGVLLWLFYQDFQLPLYCGGCGGVL